MDYNPYDLVKLIINNTPIDGRPFEFDSVVVNQHDMTNAAGQPVKPTKVATLCPGCGQGLIVVVKLEGLPPYPPIIHQCPTCQPPPPPLPDPFVNPITAGRVPLTELMPLGLPAPAAAPVTTVVQRLQQQLPRAEPVKPGGESELVPAVVRDHRPGLVEKPPPLLPVADDVGGEEQDDDFDDELVESE